MIIHNETRERFVIVDKATIEDDRLSFAARGILAFLLSKPAGWEVYTAYLVKASPQGKDFIDARLRELEEFGYIRRSRRRASDGTWDGTDVHVYEIPQRENPDTDEVPGHTATGKTGAGLTVSGKSAQSEDLLQLKTEERESLATASPSPVENVDALFDAVLKECGWELASLTSHARGRVNKAVKDLRAVGASADQVHLCAVRYRDKYPTADLTPTALSANWPALVGIITDSESHRYPDRDLEAEFVQLGRNLAHKSEATFRDLLMSKHPDPDQVAAAERGRAETLEAEANAA